MPEDIGADHWHLLISELMSNPLFYCTAILKIFLTEYSEVVKLRLWRKKDSSLYDTCIPDGTCGFQFLYQMYLRGLRIITGDTPDEYPVLLSPPHRAGFCAYLESLITKFDVGPMTERPSSLYKIRNYLEWLNTLPQEQFDHKNWIDEGSVARLADPISPFSMAIEDKGLPHPYISDQWVFIWKDTKFASTTPSFTLGQTFQMMQRDNFGILIHGHYYPLPSIVDPLGELDEALFSLVRKLRLNFSSTTVPKSLIRNMDLIDIDGREIVLVSRAYHIQDLPHTLAPLSNPLSVSLPTPDTSCPVEFELHTKELLNDTYGHHDTICLALAIDESNTDTWVVMQQLISALKDSPSSTLGEILKGFLRKHNDLLHLRVWKPLDLTLSDTCVPDGTCGFHFLYQMHLRGLRRPSPFRDEFPVLLGSPAFSRHFIQYIQSLIVKFDTPGYPELAETVVKLSHFISWRQNPSRSSFPLADWLSTGEVIRLASQESPFSLGVYDSTYPYPVISDRWCFVPLNSSVPDRTTRNGGFDIFQLEKMVISDNFGIMTDRHYCPLPSTLTPIIGCDKSLLALATNLLVHSESSMSPRFVVPLLVSSPIPRTPMRRPRPYHRLPSGEFIPYTPYISHIDLVEDQCPVITLSSVLPTSTATVIQIDKVEPLALPLKPRKTIKRVVSAPSSLVPSPFPRTMITATQVVVTSSLPKLTKAQLREPWNNPQWGQTSLGSILSKHKKDNKKKVLFNNMSELINSTKHRVELLQAACSEAVALKQLYSSNKPIIPAVVKKVSNKVKNKYKPKINSSAPIAFSDTFTHIHDNPEILGFTNHCSQSSADISICTLNVNSLSTSKLTSILACMVFMKIDVMVLTDTRHRDCTVKGYTAQVKDLLGSQSRCVHSPIAPHSTKKGIKSSVGGQLIIISHSWAGALIDHFNDPSNLGLISGIKLSTGSGSLLIMGNYWPFPSTHSNDQAQNGLWSRAAVYLNSKKIKKSPKEYIQDFITKQSDRHLGKSTCVYTSSSSFHHFI